MHPHNISIAYMKVTHKIETYTVAGSPVYSFRITNSKGAYIELTNWGARWIAAVIPDVHGQLSNVLVGYEQFSDYLKDNYYMGATIGRFANRISDATLTIDGVTYHLEKNDGKNTNHGGHSGFHQKLWQWKKLPDGIRFTLLSPDGEGGYPGNVQVTVDYQWSESNELSIRYRGKTDKETYLNMTNHAYFNLSGTTEKITEHRLFIPATQLLDTNAEFIPTGKQVDVKETPFDFTTEKPIGKDLYTSHKQLQWNKGYNHCYILKEDNTPKIVEAACLYDPQTGRQLTVKTNLPGILLYTAGYYIHPHTAICLETQFFPDTPSHSEFPSCLLSPKEEYHKQTVYTFNTRQQ